MQTGSRHRDNHGTADGGTENSGSVTPEARAEQERVLMAVLEAAGRTPKGPLVFMGYDPPFAIPFLRRNEVAICL